MTESKKFYLKDYLGPVNKRAYELLPGDLEAAVRRGFEVSLVDVAGFIRVFGFPDEKLGEYKWSDSQRWYQSADDAIRGTRGRRTITCGRLKNAAR